VARRPDDEPALTTTVAPGLYEFRDDGYSVVWWEPGSGGGLKLDASVDFGVRRDDLIVKDVPRNVVADGRSRYDRWKLAREDARESGSVPTVKLATVREWTANPLNVLPADADPGAVAIIDVPRTAAATIAASGTAFGLLVHVVVAQAPFDATRHEIDALARAEARLIGLGEAEAAAAAEIVERVFRHELVARARRADAHGACRRETAVTYTLDDGTVIEGFVDLAFEEDGRWQVIDFKTDRDLDPDGEGQYRRQVALYAAAVARATGQMAEAQIVRI